MPRWALSLHKTSWYRDGTATRCDATYAAGCRLARHNKGSYESEIKELDIVRYEVELFDVDIWPAPWPLHLERRHCQVLRGTRSYGLRYNTVWSSFLTYHDCAQRPIFIIAKENKCHVIASHRPLRLPSYCASLERSGWTRHYVESTRKGAVRERKASNKHHLIRYAIPNMIALTLTIFNTDYQSKERMQSASTYR
jgi:hypothetical protein